MKAPQNELLLVIRAFVKEHGYLCVRKKDLKQNKFIFVAYPIPESGYWDVDVSGWLPADRAWEIGTDAFVDTRRVPLFWVNIWRGR